MTSEPGGEKEVDQGWNEAVTGRYVGDILIARYKLTLNLM